ncbi:uncharacterized protein [Lepeophtheirus salmonis]|uniref:uncharacterized protein isoform X2 n=1 Tax=Lepeophtheirus salmonis TaxID=72036 RepID=UPI001AE876E1|nr:uncharacterized protein LOC121128533 isoform X2 [Lepeophtheirus salmonis]
MLSFLKFAPLAILPLTLLFLIQKTQAGGVLKALEDKYDESSGLQPLAEDTKIPTEKLMDILFWIWTSYKLKNGMSNSSYWYYGAKLNSSGANATAGNATYYLKNYYAPSSVNSSSGPASGNATWYANMTATNGTYLF